jgi:hypothetical protein
MIHPEGNLPGHIPEVGILCGACMIKRAKKLPHAITVRMVIDFGQSMEMYTPDEIKAEVILLAREIDRMTGNAAAEANELVRALRCNRQKIREQATGIASPDLPSTGDFWKLAHKFREQSDKEWGEKMPLTDIGLLFEFAQWLDNR